MENTPETQAASAQTAARATLSEGRGGILGVKAGMTQIYNDAGEALAVTVIDLRPNVVTQVKTKEKDGYIAVQIGTQEKKESKLSSSEKGRMKKSGLSQGFYQYKEFRLPENSKIVADLKIGQVLSPDFIKEGDFVDLTAVSKGKGFQGVMKRHNFSGGMASHGASVSHRVPGSIGNRADPAKVFKGKKMSGHMGHEKVSIQNVKVVKVDAENGFILVHGSVPGPRSSVVTIRRAIKKGQAR